MGVKTRFAAIRRTAKFAVDDITQIVETLVGQRGDGLERAVLYRDLVDSSIATRFNEVLQSAGSSAGLPVVSNPTIQTPTQPQGLTVSGAFTHALLEWNQPLFSGYAYTEIFRSLTNNFGSAERIATSIPNIYGDPISAGVTYYYWIRFVNENDVRGPINATAGTAVTSAIPPSYLLAQLNAKITESQLYTSLNSRINLIDTPVTGVVDSLAALDSAHDALAATVNNGTTGLAATYNRVTTVKGRIDNIGGGSGPSIESLSSTVTQHAITLGEQTAAIESIEEVTWGPTGLAARWQIKTDVNALVGGVGFYNNGVTTQFMVTANTFSIYSPGATTFSFVVQDGIVGIPAAKIIDLVVTEAQIQTVNANKITAGKISGVTLSGASVMGGQLAVGTGPFAYSFTDYSWDTINETWLAHTAFGSCATLISNNGQIQTNKITIKNSAGDIVLDADSGLGVLTVGTAQIQMAAITTLKIAGNAVIVPIFQLSSFTPCPTSNNYANWNSGADPDIGAMTLLDTINLTVPAGVGTVTFLTDVNFTFTDADNAFTNSESGISAFLDQFYVGGSNHLKILVVMEIYYSGLLISTLSEYKWQTPAINGARLLHKEAITNNASSSRTATIKTYMRQGSGQTMQGQTKTLLQLVQR